MCKCFICINESTDWTCIQRKWLPKNAFPRMHFRHCIFPVQIMCSNQNAIAQYSCCSFLFWGRLSVVSQHRRGKQGRLITFDSHKWNANGLWNHIKVSDGCEWCQTTSAWFSCHSVTFRPFSVPILTGIDVYTGWQGGVEGMEGMRKKNTASREGKKGENGRQWMKTDW